MPPKIGDYTPVREIGRGGMGVVYLARDERLDRNVAIKTLPDAVTYDEERLQRFKREARLLASLHHTHIAGVYGLHEADGRSYLVLEYVEGETLLERLRRGPVPVHDTLQIAKQIALGVEAAHASGVIHRDLKPANVKLTPQSVVKILDFGLGKALADASSSADLAGASTRGASTHVTAPGAVFGTAGYLAPEQARGAHVDKRADLFGFGCTLYELLTGQRSFPGETAVDIIGAVLHKEPDWSAIPLGTPPTIQLLLRQCLAKDRDRRLHDMSDARIMIEDAIADPSGSSLSLAAWPSPKRRAGWRTAIGLVAAAVVIALGVFFAIRAPATPASLPREPSIHFTVAPPSDELTTSTGDVQYWLTISDDGRRIAIFGSNGVTSKIYLRDLSSAETRVIPGTEKGHSPALSHDGKWLAFAEGRRLRKIRPDGGPPQTVCEGVDAGNPVWLDEDTIAFTDSWRRVMTVPASGGEPTTLATADPADESPQDRPLVLGFNDLAVVPGHRTLLASCWSGDTVDDYHVVAISLESGAISGLLRGATAPFVTRSGHLVFLREATIFAAGFDSEQMKVVGDAVPILDGVLTTSWADSACYAVSASGTLVYLPGGRRGQGRRIVRVDVGGNVEPLSELDAFVGGLRLSPDGSRLSVLTLRRDIDLWTFDLERRRLNLVHSEGEFYCPVWTPDGRYITAQFGSGAPEFIAEKAADGSGALITLKTNENLELNPSSWSPDGTLLLIEDETNGKLLGLRRGGTAEVLFNSSGRLKDPCFSPDGRWILYSSDETGTREVFLRAYPIDDRRYQVTFGGGNDPRWSRDGRTVYFVRGWKLFSLPFEASGDREFGDPTEVIDLGGIIARGQWESDFDIGPDGRIYTVSPAAWERETRQFQVMTHWDEELRRRAPIPR